MVNNVDWLLSIRHQSNPRRMDGSSLNIPDLSQVYPVCFMTPEQARAARALTSSSASSSGTANQTVNPSGATAVDDPSTPALPTANSTVPDSVSPTVSPNAPTPTQSDVPYAPSDEPSPYELSQAFLRSIRDPTSPVNPSDSRLAPTGPPRIQTFVAPDTNFPYISRATLEGLRAYTTVNTDNGPYGPLQMQNRQFFIPFIQKVHDTEQLKIGPVILCDEPPANHEFHIVACYSQSHSHDASASNSRVVLIRAPADPREFFNRLMTPHPHRDGGEYSQPRNNMTWHHYEQNRYLYRIGLKYPRSRPYGDPSQIVEFTIVPRRARIYDELELANCMHLSVPRHYPHQKRVVRLSPMGVHLKDRWIRRDQSGFDSTSEVYDSSIDSDPHDSDASTAAEDENSQNGSQQA